MSSPGSGFPRRPLHPAARRALGLLALLLAGTAGMAQTTAPSRGRLLYDTHCVACHDARMHWRDQRRATDWATLREQVRQWQGSAQLQWSDDDIDEVARYLNDALYRFERPASPRG